MDGDASSKESLRGRFFVRDDDVRSNSRVGDVSGAVLDSIVRNTEDDASDIMKEGCVFFA